MVELTVHWRSCELTRECRVHNIKTKQLSALEISIFHFPATCSHCAVWKQLSTLTLYLVPWPWSTQIMITRQVHSLPELKILQQHVPSLWKPSWCKQHDWFRHLFEDWGNHIFQLKLTVGEHLFEKDKIAGRFRREERQDIDMWHQFTIKVKILHFFLILSDAELVRYSQILIVE